MIVTLITLFLCGNVCWRTWRCVLSICMIRRNECVLANNAPFILRKHVYALVSILGAVIYYYLRLYGVRGGAASSMVIGIVFALRMLATKYQWTLPKIQYEEK